VGLVPVIIHDGTVVTESIDILRYLEQSFPENSLYSSDVELNKVIDY